MQTLRETIWEFKNSGRGLGHFNISDSNQLHAVVGGAREVGLPVVVGLSEGERDFFPLAEVRLLINLYQSQGVRVYLNADHTYSIERVREAIDAGVDSVVVDGAKLSFEDNVALLKASVEYAREKRASSSTVLGVNREVLVEGEIGYIGSSSNVIDKLPEGAAITEAMMTKPEELQKLIAESGIDLAAPAVGNIHGIVTSGQPKLSITRIAELAKATCPEPGRGVPLVLHGGSGSSDEEFVEAIKAGIAMIHINTDLRVTYKDELTHALAGAKEVAPYKFITPAVNAMQSYVAQKLRLFAGQ